MTTTKTPKPQRQSRPKGAGFCPSCGAELLANARYCHACGVAAGEARPGSRLIWWGAGIGAVAVIALAVLIVTERGKAPPRPSAQQAPAFSMPAPTSNALPDLSQMSPREAADRLFNRVMTAEEQGNAAEALQFAPMAIDAYGRLPELDRDAHYHLGLIHLVTGDKEGVTRAIAAMREGAPGHLLALILEHRAAMAAGNSDAADQLRDAFNARYEAEIAIARPEYRDHGRIIELFRGDAAATPAAPAAPAAQ